MSFSTSQHTILFTPGPLSVSLETKLAMLYDYGSRDGSFIDIVADVRARLLDLAHVDADAYAAIPLQGSGTYGIEAVFATAVPREGKVLVVVNGAYGRRAVAILERLSLPYVRYDVPEHEVPDVKHIEDVLLADEAITHVEVCHCETTSGVLNPIADIGAVVANAGRVFIVDAMSSFGGIDLQVQDAHIDFLVTSSNKCLQGVPGLALILAKKATLSACTHDAYSLALDLRGQLANFEKNGQFRFTPPTHCMLALHQALRELDAEGGITKRHARYTHNQQVLSRAMKDLGFTPFLDQHIQSPIITSFHYPDHPNWSFDTFYDALKQQGLLIYPGKVGEADTFRIGSIGHIYEKDMRALTRAIHDTLRRMDVSLLTS